MNNIKDTSQSPMHISSPSVSPNFEPKKPHNTTSIVSFFSHKFRRDKRQTYVHRTLRGILTITKNGLRNSKGILIISLALSVAITALFILIINVAAESIADIGIGVMDKDESFVSEDFAAYLKDDVGAKLKTSDDIDYMNTELLEKNISAIIEIPKGFESGMLSGNPIPLELTFLDDYANEAFVRAYVDAYTGQAVALSLAAMGDGSKLETLMEEADALTPVVDSVKKDAGQVRREAERSGFDSMLGFFMMFSFLIAIGLTSMLFFDRTNGTFRRIKSANATSVQYTIAMSLVGMVMALLTVILPLVYLAISGIDVGAPLYVPIIMILIYSIFLVGFGMFIGLSLPSLNSMIFALIAVGTVLAMLGGAYFPIDMAPMIFQKIALITPQYWCMNAIHSYQNDADPGTWLLSLGIPALMALLFFVLTAVRFASSKSSSKPLAA